MFDTVMLIIYGFVAVVILPLAIASLVAGSPPPEASLHTKYYRAEPRLMLFGNIFLLALAAMSILKIVLHFGLIDAELGKTLENWLTLPFFATLLLFLGFFVRAILKTRRAGV